MNVLLLGNLPCRGERQCTAIPVNVSQPTKKRKAGQDGALPGCVLCFCRCSGNEDIRKVKAVHVEAWGRMFQQRSQECKARREAAGASLLKKQQGGQRAEVECGGV